MSENMTPQEGSGPLSVDGAADALLGMMGGEDSQEQPDTEPEVQAGAEEAEGEYEPEAEQDSEEQEEEQPNTVSKPLAKNGR